MRSKVNIIIKNSFACERVLYRNKNTIDAHILPIFGKILVTHITTKFVKNNHVISLLEACKMAKIEPSISFHELRHTYASMLAQLGVDLLTISKLLGHADIIDPANK